MNTFRALCAELLQRLSEYDSANPYHDHRDLITRARAELAKPEPQGPTDEELRKLLYYEFTTSTGHGERVDEMGFARAVLARWGRPATEPTPVSEQPWEREGWCDAQGVCWMWHPINFHYCLCRPDPSVHTHSLPHWALPLPIPEKTQ
jgi:hypothetical protein